MIFAPNIVTKYDNFYVSYNNYDVDIYGDVTTALVLGNMEKFFILKGDFREEYSKIAKEGFEKCLQFFREHVEYHHQFSDNI